MIRKQIEPYDQGHNLYRREHLQAARFGLQVLSGLGLKRGDLTKVHAVMRLCDEEQIKLRRVAIHEAGRAAGANGGRIPTKFEGQAMGSFELMMFYDGVAETREGFENPYRLRSKVKK